MKKHLRLFLFFVIGINLGACAIVYINDRYGSVGMASWYEEVETASGEAFDRDGFTAAHRVLPFGTIVTVTNLKNSRRVDVKINDRGPYIFGRIIDLSFAAARELDMLEDGVTKVTIKILND
jgi:rare lipoprotein A